MNNTENESVLTRLIRMEEKLDGYLFRTVRNEQRVDDHDTRLRSLENGNARIMAAAGMSQRAIAQELGVSHVAVGKWLKEGGN